MAGRIKVLVIDDSALIRDILSKGLSQDPGIEVVATASDPFDARNKITKLNPQVLTLDVEMPRMDGVEFLRQLMPHHPLPVVMVSALTERGKQITLEALEAGAVDFVTKPRSDVAKGLGTMMMELSTKVKIASTANVAHWKHAQKKVVPSPRPTLKKSLAESTDKVIAIGASTGGTEAIREVLTRFPGTLEAGVVVVQHMPAGFTQMFAERMNSLCEMEVKEASEGDRVMAGKAFIAPGGNHLRVERVGGEYLVHVAPGPLVNGHCPSVEVMMSSIAEQVGRNAIGVMLTGMGRDGAAGMKQMRDAGARCLAQDEASSVVFGMPKEAFACGAAERLVPIDDMAHSVMELLTELTGKI